MTYINNFCCTRFYTLPKKENRGEKKIKSSQKTGKKPLIVKNKKVQKKRLSGHMIFKNATEKLENSIKKEEA